MNTVPLSPDDIHPYQQPESNVAVRIFKNKRWFLGKLHYIKFDSECIIRVEPMIEFTPHRSERNPIDLGKLLIEESDELIPQSLTGRWPPFKPLINPEKLTSDGIPDNVLVIRFDDGASILSTREQDVKFVDNLISSADNQK